MYLEDIEIMSGEFHVMMQPTNLNYSSWFLVFVDIQHVVLRRAKPHYIIVSSTVASENGGTNKEVATKSVITTEYE